MKNVLSPWITEEIATSEEMLSYGSRCLRITTSGGSAFILKERDLTADIAREYDLLSHLKNNGVPVAVPIATRTGELLVKENQKVLVLYPVLPGTVISEHYANGAEDRATAYGRTIAQVHLALRAYAGSGAYDHLNLVDHINTWVGPTIHSHRESGLDSSLNDFNESIGPLYDGLREHLIHRDPNTTNLLVEEGRVTGVVDFDLCVKCVRIFDPCYCATSMLIGGFADAGQRDSWPRLLRGVLHGYQEFCPFSPEEAQALLPVLQAIQLMFVAWSLESGNRPALQCNRDVLLWLTKNRDQIERTTKLERDGV